MHGVIQTPTFLADVKASGMSDEEHAEMIAIIARDPQAGALIPGTGGARKLRIADKSRSMGKSGAYRVVTYYAAEDVPVFALALIDKGERENITQAEKNALRQILGGLAQAYREGVRSKIQQLRA